MAGHSRRFREAGYQKPKFLLDCGQKKMIEHVFDMFSYQDNFHLILNKELEDIEEISIFLESLSKNIKLYFIQPHEKGPTYSIIKADIKFSHNDPVIVSYCDFTIEWDYERFKRQALGHDIAVPYFKDFQAASLGNTQYAYMQLDGDQMLQLQEKRSFTADRISEPASCGIYYFKSLNYLLELSNKLFDSNLSMPNNESYTSLLLNICKEEEGSVYAFKIDKFICLGTPEDYEQFQYWHNVFQETHDTDNNIDFSDYSLIPMAGEGSRFKKYGYKTSKPFIQIGEESLLEKCIKSLPKAKNYIFVLRKNDSLKDLIEKDVENVLPAKKSTFISIDKKTEGQAITCLLAEPYFEDESSLMISSCDYELKFCSDNLQELVNTDCDVIIFTFKLRSLPVGSYENFAYCKSSDNLNVESVIEKSCISSKPQEDHMVTGTFWFRKGKHFVEGVKGLIEEDIRINDEYYVGTSINFLINKGLKVKVFEVDNWVSFGDPIELNLYYFWQDYMRN